MRDQHCRGAILIHHLSIVVGDIITMSATPLCNMQSVIYLTEFLVILGPSFWGLINPQWMLCNKGRRQSPIDIEPAKMLYDPNLRSLSVDKHKVSHSYIYSMISIN